MRIGYAANSPDLRHPADRRRFPYYANLRGLGFEVARPGSRYDLLVVTPRADLDAWRARASGARLVLDIVDGYLDLPRHDPKALLRGPAKFAAGEARTPFFSYRAALERMIAAADAVTCASAEQAEQLRAHNPNVHAMLDYHGNMVRAVKSDFGRSGPLRLVWEGLGHNVEWFREIQEALEAVDGSRTLEVHLITSIEFRQYVQRFRRRSTLRLAARYIRSPHLHQWSEAMVSVIASACDLAVIPLPLDRRFERLKPENKLVSFWRMGLPTVVSSTPSYNRAMAGAGLEMACANTGEWVEVLERHAADEDLRRAAAARGRRYAEEHHGDEATTAAWDRALGLA